MSIVVVDPPELAQDLAVPDMLDSHHFCGHVCMQVHHRYVHGPKLAHFASPNLKQPFRGYIIGEVNQHIFLDFNTHVSGSKDPYVFHGLLDLCRPLERDFLGGTVGRRGGGNEPHAMQSQSQCPGSERKNTCSICLFSVRSPLSPPIHLPRLSHLSVSSQTLASPRMWCQRGQPLTCPKQAPPSSAQSRRRFLSRDSAAAS